MCFAGGVFRVLGGFLLSPEQEFWEQPPANKSTQTHSFALCHFRGGRKGRFGQQGVQHALNNTFLRSQGKSFQDQGLTPTTTSTHCTQTVFPRLGRAPWQGGMQDCAGSPSSQPLA